MLRRILDRIQCKATKANFNIELLPNPEDEHVSRIVSIRVPDP
jgi:hypothetical protein